MRLPATEITPLPAEERSRLKECEDRIEAGFQTFYEVGLALLEIRDSRLYREDYQTFEDYCRDRWGVSRRRSYQLIDAAKVISNLSPENVNNCSQSAPRTESQARPLTQLDDPEEQRDAWREATQNAESEGREVTAKDVQDAVERKKTPHVAHNSGENEWYTPEKYLEAARAVMGGIDLDPASSAIANETVQAAAYYTQACNGLTQPWRGNVWLNPPYAQPLIKHFSKAVVEKYRAGEFSQACVLVNNATETAWFQAMLLEASAVCFIRGRVKFLDLQGQPSGAPLQGQAVLYFGPAAAQFSETFSALGAVLR